MASIEREFLVHAPADFVWDAIKDFGAVHTRLAAGFVTATETKGQVRTVTFVNGFVVQEELVTVSDAQRRFVYRAVGGRATHHNAAFRVVPAGGDACTVTWTTDLLPDEMAPAIEQMVEHGSAAIRRTLEAAHAAQAAR
jgi:carbon monoxide dehydrogenase subunit G